MKLYFSQLTLDVRSRQVRSELQNTYELHRTIMRAFPTEMSEGERILFRVEKNKESLPVLLVQSTLAPDWDWLNNEGLHYLLIEDDINRENPAVKSVNLTFQNGQLLSFRLKANPTEKKKSDGRRHALLGDERLMEWLKSKLELGGAMLEQAMIYNEGGRQAQKNSGNENMALFFSSVLFEGVLQVKDAEVFCGLIRNGVGSGKGFGFGLLSVAPCMR